ncbi:hypothetical protein ASE63_21090 [Bosea sp. Root381]|uniref:hypothetical protein n=1 Tax=Bosea sp. Root381 TaxID=1736524 RepID=UPI0006F36944|nr:hypothetical protein [Bosea sp. Root381]KRE09492.1 hypothetical protein ASE63_21090 [Bosea sp. Root381]
MDDSNPVRSFHNDDKQSRHAAHQKTVAANRHDSQRAYDGDRHLRRLFERQAYRKAKEEAGGTVRSYRSTKRLPRLPSESEEEFIKRIRRERERERRGVSAETVRPYVDLSSLTLAQKAQRKAEQAAERKRRQRAGEKARAMDNLDPAELQAISAALDELDAI